MGRTKQTRRNMEDESFATKPARKEKKKADSVSMPPLRRLMQQGEPQINVVEDNDLNLATKNLQHFVLQEQEHQNILEVLNPEASSGMKLQSQQSAALMRQELLEKFGRRTQKKKKMKMGKSGKGGINHSESSDDELVFNSYFGATTIEGKNQYNVFPKLKQMEPPAQGNAISLSPRQLFYDLECVKDHYPIDRLHVQLPLGVFHQIMQPASYFYSLDFSGVEQLTDFALYRMTKIGTETFQHLKVLNLSGCPYLTDMGMKWCRQAIGYLQLDQLYLRHCSQLTIQTLREFYHPQEHGNPKQIDMCFTSLTEHCTYKEQKQGSQHPYRYYSNVLTNGCMLANSNIVDEFDEYAYRGYFQLKSELSTSQRGHQKVIILKNRHLQSSLIGDQSDNDSTSLKFVSWLHQDVNYNIFECNEIFLPSIMDTETIYTFFISEKNEKESLDDALNMIFYVLSKLNSHCVNFLLLVEGQTDKKKMKKLKETIEEKFQKVRDRLLESVTKCPLAGMTFKNQQSARDALALVEFLSRPMLYTLQALQLNKSSKEEISAVLAAAKKILHERMVPAWYQSNGQPEISSKLKDFMDNVPLEEFKEQPITAKKLIKKTLVKLKYLSSFGEEFGKIEKALNDTVSFINKAKLVQSLQKENLSGEDAKILLAEAERIRDNDKSLIILIREILRKKDTSDALINLIKSSFTINESSNSSVLEACKKMGVEKADLDNIMLKTFSPFFAFNPDLEFVKEEGVIYGCCMEALKFMHRMGCIIFIENEQDEPLVWTSITHYIGLCKRFMADSSNQSVDLPLTVEEAEVLGLDAPKLEQQSLLLTGLGFSYRKAVISSHHIFAEELESVFMPEYGDSYVITLPFSLPNILMLEIGKELMKCMPLSNIHRVSKTGIIVKNNLITIIIALSNDGRKITIYGGIPLTKKSGANSQILSFMTSMIDPVQLVVEFIAASHHLPIDSCTARSQVIVQCQHQFLDGKSCSSCHQEALKLQRQWHIYKHLNPTFLSEVKLFKDLPLAPAIGHNIRLDSDAKYSVKMNAWDCNQLEVLFSRTEVDGLLLNLASTTEGSDHQQVSFSPRFGYAIVPGVHVPIVEKIAVWPQLRTSLVYNVVLQCSSNPGETVVLFKAANVVVFRCILHATTFNLTISTYPPVTVEVNVRKMPKRLFDQNHPLCIGARMEAWDVKTPRLVCAATLCDIDDEEKQLNVHFDGWKGYDYWVPLTSTHIHPAGYMEVIGSINTSYEPTVAKPKFWKDDDFTWNKYLRVGGYKAISLAWFSQEQSGDMTAPEELKSHLALPPNCSNVLPNSLPERLDNCSGNLCLDIKKSALAVSFCMRTLLPGVHQLKQCTEQCLYLPQKKLDPTHSLQLESQDVYCHRLCGSEYKKMDVLHFLNAEGSKSEAKVEFRHLCNFVNIVLLLNGDDFLPGKLDKLVKNASNVSMKQVKEWLCKELGCIAQLLFLQYSMFDMIVQSQFSKLDLHEFVKRNVSLKGQSSRITCCVHEGNFINQYRAGEVEQEDQRTYGHLLYKIAPGKSLSPSENLKNLDSYQMKNIWSDFPNLQEVSFVDFHLERVPEGVSKCDKLVHLSLRHNNLRKLPDGFACLAPTLKLLDLSHNPFLNVPDVVFELTELEDFKADNICLDILSEKIGELKKLKVLSLNCHIMKTLPKSFTELSELVFLDLSGIPWQEDLPHQLQDGLVKGLDLEEHISFLKQFNAVRELWTKEAMAEIFTSSKVSAKARVQYIDIHTVHTLNARLFRAFPRFEDFPNSITCLRNLHRLVLNYQAFCDVPEKIGDLNKLAYLSLKNCIHLESLNANLVQTKLEGLSIRGCVSLKTPPREIVSRGFKAIMGYLKRLTMGATHCHRTKLMLVGLGGAGKTSLVRSLVTPSHQTFGTTNEEVTDGIDIKPHTLTRQTNESKQSVTYSIWDFAGQTVYYNTHQFFLSNRAVYFLVWNIRLGHQHAGLDFWLNSINCHAPKAPVFVIGTHIDKVEKPEIPADEMKKKYPQIQGFHNISAIKGTGMPELIDDLLLTTLKEAYMGEEIPEAWLEFERDINEKATKDKKDFLQFNEIVEIAMKTGIMADEVNEVIRFLHELGSLQHFNSESLKSKVIINPQWIVDVMKCVVSVHDNEIQNGKLKHADLNKVWPEDRYPQLQNWLLKLTEEFDLTFPLKSEPASLVPCLLQENEVEYDWEINNINSNLKNSNVQYIFDYLPAGLFNRAQVRLSQYSESSIIWKRGSKLVKNNHQAIIQQLNDKEINIRVQGLRPENIIFMIHEIFEGLIKESFHGIQFDFLLPCLYCIEEHLPDPSMFRGSRINRAISKNAPYLQCYDYFHTLSVSQLQEMLPPSSSKDVEMHLRRNIQEIKQLRRDMASDLFLLHSGKHEKGNVTPKNLQDDLSKAGFTMWMYSPEEKTDIAEKMVLLKSSQLLLIMMTDHLANDETCIRMLKYAIDNLKKPIKLILTENSMKWKKTEIGAKLGEQVYVNMAKEKHYKTKLKELEEMLKGNQRSSDIKDVDCFISYCWLNSAEACSKSKKEVVGLEDPRKLKEYFEKNRVKCWLDVEQTGVKILYEDISEGLNNCQVMVACLSDEYVTSENCMMEYRHANNIKKPIIIARVGKSSKWTSGEVGLLASKNQLVDIDFIHQSPTSHSELLREVRKHINKEEKEKKKREAQAVQASAFQEMLELLQRKVLRQLGGMNASISHTSLPRLVVIDLLSKEDLPEQKDKDEKKALPNEKSQETESKDEEANKNSDLKRPSTAASTKNEKAIINDAEKYMIYNGKVVCFRILCEHERGWHLHGAAYPLKHNGGDGTPFDSLELLLSDWSGYLLYIYAIVQMTNIDLQILISDEGVMLQNKLDNFVKARTQDNSTEDVGYILHSYNAFLRYFNSLEFTYPLKRCQLPTSRILWLCEEHRKLDDKITILLDDEVDSSAYRETNEKMIEELRRLSGGTLRQKFVGAHTVVNLVNQGTKYVARRNQMEKMDNKKKLNKSLNKGGKDGGSKPYVNDPSHACSLQ